jgi:Holliday junction resolvasome RuvABC DNA-binding subunit
MGNGVPTNVPTNAPTNENENINNNINDYTEELAALNNLGFDSNEENRLLLQLYNGNVNYVANLLLEQ